MLTNKVRMRRTAYIWSILAGRITKVDSFSTYNCPSCIGAGEALEFPLTGGTATDDGLMIEVGGRPYVHVGDGL